MISFLIVNEIHATNSVESESAFRRGEVIFFLSSPFTFLFSAILIGGVYTQVSKQDFTPAKWPQEVWIGVGSLSLLSSGLIVYYDYVEMEKKKRKDKRLIFKFQHKF
jgi:heme/copper-type cytochrome/quinol oxidase subunit 3